MITHHSSEGGERMALQFLSRLVELYRERASEDRSGANVLANDCCCFVCLINEILHSRGPVLATVCWVCVLFVDCCVLTVVCWVCCLCSDCCVSTVVCVVPVVRLVCVVDCVFTSDFFTKFDVGLIDDIDDASLIEFAGKIESIGEKVKALGGSPAIQSELMKRAIEACNIGGVALNAKSEMERLAAVRLVQDLEVPVCTAAARGREPHREDAEAESQQH